MNKRDGIGKQPAHKPTRRRDSQSGTNAGIIAVVCALAVLVIGVGAGITYSFGTQPAPEPQAETSSDMSSDASSAATGESRVSFVAVGDNLPNDVIGAYADACAGDVGDGQYDYHPLYQYIKPLVESADLAYIKEETHLGGDEFGPRGWPSFNTTDTMADAVVDTGFDLVASASNHAYDWGSYGAVEHSRSIWNAQPVAFTGTAASEEEAATIPVVERGGITFSLLDYTYGVNGFTQADLPSYSVNFIDEERIRTDVARAKEISDVVLVAMHWGTENQTEPDEDQLYYAQLLADLEVDVVLGSHPHVIGPLAWVEGASGHKTLVAYSLGNFLSCHEEPSALNELEGMLSCTFVKNDAGVHIEDVVWTPLVNHQEEGAYAVYPVKDYTAELAERATALGELDDPLTWLADTSKQIVGEEFTIDV